MYKTIIKTGIEIFLVCGWLYAVAAGMQMLAAVLGGK